MCRQCFSDEWICASQDLAPNSTLVCFSIISMVCSYESGGGILHCATSAAFMLCVCVCITRLTAWIKILLLSFLNFVLLWLLIEVLFDKQQNNLELVSLDFWHAVSSRKEKKGQKKGPIYHFEMSDHQRKEADVTFFAQNSSPRFLHAK